MKWLIKLLLILVIPLNVDSQIDNLEFGEGREFKNKKKNIEYLGEINGKLYTLSADWVNKTAFSDISSRINAFDKKLNLISETRINEKVNGVLYKIIKVIIIENKFYAFSSRYTKDNETHHLYFVELKLVGGQYITIPGEEVTSSNIYNLNLRIKGATTDFNYIYDQPDPFNFIYSPDKNKICVVAVQESIKSDKKANGYKSFTSIAVFDIPTMKVENRKANINISMYIRQAKQHAAITNSGDVYLINKIDNKNEISYKLLKLNAKDNFALEDTEKDEESIKNMYLFTRNNSVCLGMLEKSESNSYFFDNIILHDLEKNQDITIEIESDKLQLLYSPIIDKITEEGLILGDVKVHGYYHLKNNENYCHVIEFEAGKYSENLGLNTYHHGMTVVMLLWFDSKGNYVGMNDYSRLYYGMGLITFGNNKSINVFNTNSEIIAMNLAYLVKENETFVVGHFVKDEETQAAYILNNKLNYKKFSPSFLHFETDDLLVFEVKSRHSCKMYYFNKDTE